MEDRPAGNALKALPIKLNIAGQLVDMHLLLSPEGELTGVSNPQLLIAWLGGNTRAATPVPHAPITQETRRDVQFFGAGPCWFPGCEELRDAYKAEEHALSERPDCKNCERGALLRKYFKKVADAQKFL